MSPSALEKTGRGRRGPVTALAALLLLTACMGQGPGATMFRAAPGQAPADPAAGALVASAPQLTRKGEVVSPVIDALLARPSILPPGSAYHGVAEAVLAASKGAAQAELRVARLTAQARSKNWLPSIGPSLSLAGLSSIAASMMLEQAILDNGRRKAERAYAAADVEVAAVTLATDLNGRVHDGLAHYIEAQRARELAALSAQALSQMAEYERIVTIRAEGGLSDRSEMQVIAQKRLEVEGRLADDRNGEARAWAELEAMADRSLTGLSGLTPLPADPGSPEPLSVLQAQGEGARMKAEAAMARAGALPGLGASVDLAGGGLAPNLGLGGVALGPGTRAQIEALEMTAEVADRKVAEAAETAERRRIAAEQQIGTLSAREAEQARAILQGEGNLELFTEQYKAGRRSLLELVGQYESLAALKRDQASLKYDIALLRLGQARDRGVLVAGGAM